MFIDEMNDKCEDGDECIEMLNDAYDPIHMHMDFSLEESTNVGNNTYKNVNNINFEKFDSLFAKA